MPIELLNYTPQNFLRHNSPQPSASSVHRYFVWSTILTGLNRLGKMSLYSKGLLLIFLRPNKIFISSLRVAESRGKFYFG